MSSLSLSLSLVCFYQLIIRQWTHFPYSVSLFLTTTKSVIANKSLYKRTKMVFGVFVTSSFHHGGGYSEVRLTLIDFLNRGRSRVYMVQQQYKRPFEHRSVAIFYLSAVQRYCTASKCYIYIVGRGDGHLSRCNDWQAK